MSRGREVAPTLSIGRPRFRNDPGPPVAAALSVPLIALAVFGFLTFRASLSPGFSGSWRSARRSSPRRR